ncbi:hypothetical protein [Parachlamydia sp. AcF125]|uniref:hypothetical protein n=1 Tax=Parachlamydia sp. AcF125 TaxID=2795736 RepID=UPI001BC8EAFD|nr:hypothetical protein [Parachlamydia sp. AcF125]
MLKKRWQVLALEVEQLSGDLILQHANPQGLPNFVIEYLQVEEGLLPCTTGGGSIGMFSICGLRKLFKFHFENRGKLFSK